MHKHLTLCLITKEDQILLGMKKRGFGAGRWNGFGGKVQEGESIIEAAIRETQEEANILVKNLQQVGSLEFEFQGDSQILGVHVFKTTHYIGQPEEGEEMRPQWFPFSNMPYKDMWPDDVLWMPKVLSGKRIKGKFLFAPGDIIVDQQLEEFE
jgi:8-oxo-dGTP diphosphatase/2-hydroxy-dATP diphosphatase